MLKNIYYISNQPLTLIVEKNNSIFAWINIKGEVRKLIKGQLSDFLSNTYKQFTRVEDYEIKFSPEIRNKLFREIAVFLASLDTQYNKKFEKELKGDMETLRNIIKEEINEN